MQSAACQIQWFVIDVVVVFNFVFFNRSLWLNILFIVRLLLWDLDERRYSYYIEVSCDQQSWVRVVDKTKEECRSELLLYVTTSNYLNIVLVLDAKLKLQNSKWLNFFGKITCTEIWCCFSIRIMQEQEDVSNENQLNPYEELQ